MVGGEDHQIKNKKFGPFGQIQQYATLNVYVFAKGHIYEKMNLSMIP